MCTWLTKVAKEPPYYTHVLAHANGKLHAFSFYWDYELPLDCDGEIFDFLGRIGGVTQFVMITRVAQGVFDRIETKDVRAVNILSSTNEIASTAWQSGMALGEHLLFARDEDSNDGKTGCYSLRYIGVFPYRVPGLG
jgi:hypothetical protein